MNSPEVCQCCPGLDIFTSSRYFSRQKDLHIRSGCNERYFRRPGNLQIKNRSFALFYESSGHLGNMAISMSQLSLAPFSKIHIFPESSSCVDTGRMLVPKDTIKNCASTLLYFTEGHFFVTVSALEILRQVLRQNPRFIQTYETFVHMNQSLCTSWCFIKSIKMQITWS